MLFVGSAQPNRSQCNGLMPNGHGFRAIASDDVPCVDAHTETQAYFLSLSDTLTSTGSVVFAHGITGNERVVMTAWAKAKVHDPLSDFE